MHTSGESTKGNDMKTTTPRSTKLMASLSAAFALAGMCTSAFAATIPVTSCADDNSPGTLRQAAAGLSSGDTLDLSGLTCTGATITLTQGEIVLEHNATLVGSAQQRLTITSTGRRILNSTSSDEPGGFVRIDNLNISGGRVYTEGDSAYGGCILAAGSVELVSSSVSNCIASNSNGVAMGGGIFAQSVTLTLSSVSGNVAGVSGNSRSSRGGGIYAGSLSCTDSTLSGNMALTTADGAYGQGGGALIVGGDMTLSRCTVDSNASGVGGGVMQFMFGGTTSVSRIENSTISGNSATFASAGLDVFCPDCVPTDVQIVNSTVAFNTATYGGAVTTNGNVIVTSSIIAQNSVTGEGEFADVSAADLSGADNLIQSTSLSPAAGVITAIADPQLQPLSDNGGPTLTHALANTSPALNSGNNTALLETDQRGQPRVVAEMVDMGAYQSQPSSATAAAGADEIFHGGF